MKNVAFTNGGILTFGGESPEENVILVSYNKLSKYKKVSSHRIKILESELHYPLKLSIIMICETADYNMRNNCLQFSSLDKSYLSKTVFEK